MESFSLNGPCLFFLSSVFLVPIFTSVFICLGNGKDSRSMEASWSWNSSRKRHCLSLSVSRLFPQRTDGWEKLSWGGGGWADLTATVTPDLWLEQNGASSPISPGKETALSQREVNKVLGKEKGLETQSKIRISESREWDKRRSEFMELKFMETLGSILFSSPLFLLSEEERNNCSSGKSTWKICFHTNTKKRI